MDTLPELPIEFPPIADHLAEIWQGLPDATLEEEQGRLTERFLDIGSKLLAITQMREQSEPTVST